MRKPQSLRRRNIARRGNCPKSRRIAQQRLFCPANELNFMKHVSKSLFTVALTAMFCAGSLRAEDPKATEPLDLKLPAHTLKGTPEDLPAGPNIEPPSDKAPKPLQVPKGVKNVAAGKPVTSSVAPFLGELSQITDGKREP